MPSRGILVIDDDAGSRSFLATALSTDGHKVIEACDGVKGLLAMEASRPDLVFCDLSMPVMDGLEFLDLAHERWPSVPVVILTVSHDVSAVVKAIQLGAVNYLLKPVSPGRLRALARATLGRSDDAVRENAAFGIVGVSRNILEVRHIVDLASRSDVNVLISGPTGTGKELAARAIHARSPRSGSPFIAQNSAAIPPDLFESQFFGHCRGSFTGAEKDQPGLLQMADGGTLFLDELEGLDVHHQAKLLRVLDDGEIRKLGSRDVFHVSVRFLAATNRDTATMLEEKTLREDLYYRLRGLEIRIKPLCERPEDIEYLTEHFLEGQSVPLHPDALQKLHDHPWPGNVRELRNVLAAAAIRAGEGPILPQHLHLEGPEGLQAGTRAFPGGSLKEIEKAIIIQTLERHGGNRSRAARALKIDRATLRRKLKG